MSELEQQIIQQLYPDEFTNDAKITNVRFGRLVLQEDGSMKLVDDSKVVKDE